MTINAKYTIFYILIKFLSNKKQSCWEFRLNALNYFQGNFFLVPLKLKDNKS